MNTFAGYLFILGIGVLGGTVIAGIPGTPSTQAGVIISVVAMGAACLLKAGYEFGVYARDDRR